MALNIFVSALCKKDKLTKSGIQFDNVDWLVVGLVVQLVGLLVNTL